MDAKVYILSWGVKNVRGNVISLTSLRDSLVIFLSEKLGIVDWSSNENGLKKKNQIIGFVFY
jgi:hypothetical protein